jgi:Ca2+-binding RTX toxin-like protein
VTSRSLNRSAVLACALTVLVSLLWASPAQAAPRCFGRRATIVGTGKNDKINGTPGKDVIVGGGGHDRISGRGGDDLICGGSGRDTLRGKAGDDRLNGGNHSDFMFGHAGNDELRGFGGADVLNGARGNDDLEGGSSGELVLIGGPGDDLYNGGPGLFDLASFEGSPAGVIVDLNVLTSQNTNEGIDTLLGVEGVTGSLFNDRITGQNVASPTGNGLFGLDGVDEILGLDGDDTIDGELGHDRGGPGVGQLNGGAGNDLVLGGSGDDDLYGDTGNDLLDGFEDGETPGVGDFGSGGPDTDECFGLETNDGTCEMNTPRLTSSQVRWTNRAVVGPW